jgi:hypothetical protein
MTTIYEVIKEIVKVQERLAIVEPVQTRIVKAYPFFPSQATTAAIATPCVMNEWTLTRIERDISLKTEFYTIHSQVLVRDADLDRAAWIATAFMPVYAAAFDQRAEDGAGGVSLNGLVVNQTVRGGNPTLGRVERTEGVYMSLDLFMDVTIQSGVAFS